MSKKVLSVLLVVAMMVTVLCVGGISASASTMTGKIYFEVPESWGELTTKSAIYAHVWVNGGEEYAAWQTKAEKMKVVSGRTYSFDIAKSPKEEGSNDWNMVIFSMAQGPQTYDLTMGLNCIGDTGYVTDEVVENPQDSSKTALVARWKADKTQGPHLVISSIGNIVGDSLLPGETTEDVLNAFIKAYPGIATEEKIAELREKLPKPPVTEPTTTDPSATEDTTPTQAPTTKPTEPATDKPAPTDPPTVAPTDPSAPTESTTDAYGRERGIPVPDGVKMPERVTQPNGEPGDGVHEGWDGYCRIYYFKAPENWLANADKKEEGYEIGFYWYYGTENGGEWPGVVATKLNVEGAENIYYAIAPSYANNIIWNNGIDEGLPTQEDYDISKKGMGIQTADINVEDGMFNQLGQDDLCGSLAELTGETITVENPLTGQTQTTYLADWSYFNPLTGEKTLTPLTVDGKVMQDENGFDMNPYFDMDYSYVRPGPNEPIKPPTSETIPTEATDPSGNGGTTPGGKAPGTVNTAQDVAMFVILATVLLAAAGIVVVARRKREQG